jgi:hypothetical protein
MVWNNTQDFWLPRHLQQTVDEELRQTESIRWMGQPSSHSFPWLSLFPFFFGVFWTAFSVVWIGVASGIGNPVEGFHGFDQLEGERLMFALFGIPFLLIGFAMLTAPFWTMRWIKRSSERTVYVITNERVIIFDGGFSDRSLGLLMAAASPLRGRGLVVRSFKPGEIQSIRRIRRRDGSGNIVLHLINEKQPDEFTYAIPVVFFSIPNVKDVGEMLEEFRAQAGDS